MAESVIKFKAPDGKPNIIVWNAKEECILGRFRNGYALVKDSNKVVILKSLGFEVVTEKATKTTKEK